MNGNLKKSNMGFIQKLAKKSDRVKVKVKAKKAKPVSCNCEYKYKTAKIPKLTWRYVLTLKNWR